MKKKLIGLTTAIVLAIGLFGFKPDFFEIAKQIEIFTTLYKELNMNYVDETVPAELMDKAVKGMLEELDPYTVYYNEQDVERSHINRAGAHSGIGAVVKTHGDGVVIMEPWRDGPADKAGLKGGDRITRIDDIDVADFRENAAELLSGQPGSTVDVTYLRQGKTHTTTITRETARQKPVPFHTLIDGEIAYIKVSSFTPRVSAEVKAAFLDLKSQGAQSLILDLRGNPGGLMNEAIEMVSLFVPKDVQITSTRSVIEKYNRVYKTKRDPVDTDIPLAVLINGRSASASEIVSGAVQDLDRGVVVGARSFGKGLVQRVKKLSYGTQLKITISHYFTPSGRSIQAEDYFSQDEHGDPIRATAREYNAFRTKNGRTVYDGGGITPDVELESAAFSPVTTALIRDHAIFDYATGYYYDNRVPDIKRFKFNDKDFNDFLSFLRKKGFSYETRTETALQEVMESAETEEIKEDIEHSYNALLADIDKAKADELRQKKAEITTQLTDEIVKRYFYREGLYEYQIENNPEIREAVAILRDKRRYEGILKP